MNFFPSNLNVSRDEVEGNLEVQGEVFKPITARTNVHWNRTTVINFTDRNISFSFRTLDKSNQELHSTGNLNGNAVAQVSAYEQKKKMNKRN